MIKKIFFLTFFLTSKSFSQTTPELNFGIDTANIAIGARIGKMFKQDDGTYKIEFITTPYFEFLENYQNIAYSFGNLTNIRLKKVIHDKVDIGLGSVIELQENYPVEFGFNVEVIMNFEKVQLIGRGNLTWISGTQGVGPGLPELTIGAGFPMQKVYNKW